MNRRDFVAATAATLATAAAAPGVAESHRSTVLRAGKGEARLLPDTYPSTDVWAFDGGIPGPTIRAKQGDMIRRTVVNDLDQPTAVHWHGIRLDNTMDGVPGLTQTAIGPGESFRYAFTPPDAGTFWYHSHNRSMEQVARGLYGVLIVDESSPPAVDADYAIAIDDWRLDPETAQIVANFDDLHDLSHAGRLGNLVTVNGAFETRWDVRKHDRLRLRLLNAANARIFTLGFVGLEGWIMALDGMPLDAPIPANEPLVLAPGQRADVIVEIVADQGEEAYLVSYERDGGYAIATFDISGTASVARRPAPMALPPIPVAGPLNLSAAGAYDLLMEGGAMGGMPGAVLGGQERSMRQLIEAGQFWAFNGVAGLPEAPFIQAQKNETKRIRMTNDTAFPHAIHLHGHHIREIGQQGALGPFRDTLLLARGERREIIFQADNPGDWLLHCHMLGHQSAGMKTWIRVAS